MAKAVTIDKETLESLEQNRKKFLDFERLKADGNKKSPAVLDIIQEMRTLKIEISRLSELSKRYDKLKEILLPAVESNGLEETYLDSKGRERTRLVAYSPKLNVYMRVSYMTSQVLSRELLIKNGVSMDVIDASTDEQSRARFELVELTTNGNEEE